MMRNKRAIISLIVIVLLIMAGFGACAIKKGNIQTITFTVPDVCSIDENNLKSFNDELSKDGYNYALNIKYFGIEDYSSSIAEALENGETDIAFLGFGNGDSNLNNVYNLINSGNLLCLDEILLQKEGEALYNLFPKNLWEAVKCNKHIYSIPSTLSDDEGLYVAFNTNYVGNADIENWDGSIEGIYEIVSKIEWNGSSNPRFHYLLNEYSFDDMIRCEIVNGLVFDYDSLTVENVENSEKVTNYFKVLDQMTEEGYMDSVPYLNNYGTNNQSAYKTLESGDFAAALGCGVADRVFLKDNIVIKRVKPYLSSRINGSVGISKNSKNVDDVVEFLRVLYGEEKYGNILLYGKEGLDYKVIDGIMYNMDGTEMNDKYLKKIGFNLFMNILPVSGEKYATNRKDTLFALYDSIELSPFIGFEPDTSVLNEDQSNFDEYVESVKQQWEEFKK